MVDPLGRQERASMNVYNDCLVPTGISAMREPRSIIGGQELRRARGEEPGGRGKASGDSNLCPSRI